MFRTILFALLAVFAFSTVAIAEEATADTTGWWDEIVLNIPDVKLGSIGLDADENDYVIADAEGITWDIAGSLTLGEWRGFEGDIGFSKAGVGFVAITRDMFSLNDIKNVSLPGANYITVNVGVFAGRDFDGKAEGIDTNNRNVIFGAVVNFLGF